LDLSPLNGPELVFPGRTEDLPAPSNRHYPCIQDFVNAILSGQAPRSSGATALVTDWVLGEAKSAAIRP
jgi:hypothetical protein